MNDEFNPLIALLEVASREKEDHDSRYVNLLPSRYGNGDRAAGLYTFNYEDQGLIRVLESEDGPLERRLVEERGEFTLPGGPEGNPVFKYYSLTSGGRRVVSRAMEAYCGR